MNIGERLKEWRSKPPKITQAEAADIVGVNIRTWNDYEANRSEPPISLLEKFAENRGVPLFAILEGQPFEIGRKLPIVDRIPAGPIVQGFGEGGVLGYMDSDLRDPDAFALIVHGVSMWPMIEEGDIVLCSPRAPFVNGRVYAVVTTKGEHSLKQVRYDERAKGYALIPANKDFPTLYVPENEVLKLIRVVQARRDFQ